MVAIAQNVLANFERYSLGPLYARLCPELPWAMKSAVAAIESEGDNTIFNVYDGAGKLHLGHWDGRKPPRPKTYANSTLQILTKYNRGLSLEEMFTPEKAAGVIFPELMRFYRWAYEAGLRGADLYAGTYAGHNRGAGNAKAASARVKVPTIEAYVAAMPYMPDSAKPRAIKVYKHVAELVAAWEPLHEQFVPLEQAPPPADIAPVEDWHNLASWIPDDALWTMDPAYCNEAEFCCAPPDLLVCEPDEGPMSYAAAPAPEDEGQ